MNKETLRMQMLAGVITEGQYKEKLQEGIFQNLLAKLKGNKKPEPVEKSELDGLTDEQAQTLYDEYMEKASAFDPRDPTYGGWSTAAETIAFKIKRMYPNVKELPTKNESLNESMIGGIVGVGAINQIPATPKTDYEMAFEHFLGERYETNFDNREQNPLPMEEGEVNENMGSPIYELINDMHDEIFQNTGVDGKIKPYGSIPFVPVADEDDFHVILYTKGDQQIAVGCDFDYGVSPEGNDQSVWNVDVNENVDYDFGEDLSFDDTVNAVSNWLES